MSDDEVIDLALATDDQILTELARRHTAVVVATVTVRGNREAFFCRYGGIPVACIGALSLSLQYLRRDSSLERMPIDEEEGEGDSDG